MRYPRIYDNLEKYLEPGRVLVIYGPRRVGKTTILKSYLAKTTLKYLLETGDNIKFAELLGSGRLDDIKKYVQGYDLVALDEVQLIPNIGQGLKILADYVPNLKIIATGSSSFDIADKVGEPLTGRKNTLTLYPLSFLELSQKFTPLELARQLNDFLVLGMYPEVLTTENRTDKIRKLEEISNSYLFKDILALDGLRKSKVVVDLVKLLAFQVGSEVSINELAITLAISGKTVEKYLDLLEKSFVIKRVGALSRNLRDEVKSKSKYYFLDNGIRNAVISQFNDLTDRNDIGQLWENFVFAERLKTREYKKIYANVYFWRTYDGKEVDLVEEYGGKLHGVEFKWKDEHVHPADEFVRAYPDSEVKVINRDNFADFLLN